MRLLFLHLDAALREQGALLDVAREHALMEVDARSLGPALRLWSRPAAIDALHARLQAELGTCAEPLVAFGGSGDFHHVSALLIARAAGNGAGPVTIVHFDNHPDWVRFSHGLHCGSWVARAARLPGVARVITLGVCSDDISRHRVKDADLSLLEDDRLELYPWRMPDGLTSLRLCGREWPTIETVGEAAFADLLLSRIRTRRVYVTIDKDVLRTEDAVTNWDQGHAPVGFVTGLVRRLAEHHSIAGADVVGDWSPPVYAGMLQGGLKRAEALVDQPWGWPAASALAVNEVVNVRLLRVFEEVTS